MIYKSQIRDMIKKLELAGAKVSKDTHYIVASETVKFSTENLPLAVRRRDDIQPGVVFIIEKKDWK